MSILADRILNVKPSLTLGLVKKAKEMKAAGKPVISLGAGEPDFDTPEFIKDAAKRAMDAGDTKYTPIGGSADMIKAVQEKYKRENGLDYKADEIIVSTGGKQVLYNALMVTVNKGDEVIIPAPYWVSYPEMVELAEGTSVFVGTTAEDRFLMKPEALAAVITPKAKWLILNSPSNPTGSAYTVAELEALAEVLRKHPHVYVLCDDIYEYLVYNDFQFKTLAEIAPDLKPRILIASGMSKGFSMTGWRIGYGLGSAEIIKAMVTLQGQATSNPCSIAQAAAVAALNGDRGFLTEWLQSFTVRRDFVVDGLNSCAGLSCLRPEGAFYVFPSCKGLLGQTTAAGGILQTDTDFADWLLQDYNVVVVPGSAFGADGYFRISYATSMAELQDAINRITKACASLKSQA